MKPVNNKKTARKQFALTFLRNRFLATALVLGLLGGVILARPHGVAAYGVPSLSYNIALRSVRTLASWLHLAPASTALASTINLTPTVSGCYYTGGQSKATISVEVDWAMIADGQTINVTVGSTTRTIGVNSAANPPIVSPQVVAFEVDANAGNYTINAELASNSAINNSAVVTAPAACVPLTCAVNDLGGTVFNDYNADGIKQAGETNGMPGVTITAFDVDGTTYTTTSSSTGRYCLTVPTGKYPVRVEFTNLPAESSGGFATPSGTDNQSTVQFVAAPDTTVDLGVNNPADYCQANPKVLTPCYVFGNPLATTGTPSLDSANEPALVRFNYSADGIKVGLEHFADAGEIGSVWALAYKRQTNHLFTAATVRRHSGLGPQGLGGIYVLNPTSGTNTGNVIDSWSVTTQLGVDVQNPGSPFGGSATAATSNTNRGLSANKASPSQDAAGFSGVGKLGIGDIDLSEDGQTLYFVNHYDQKLYAVDISGYDPSNTATRPTAANVTSYVVPDPGCAGGAWRPSGLKVRRTSVYVGGVCDAESTQSLSDLRASVQAFDTTASTWSEIFNFPLSYPKGSSDGPTAEKGWHPWSDNWETVRNGVTFLSYSVPMFTDIEFDLDGSMVLGFNDRTGMQTGRDNFRPTDGTGSFSAFAGGDTLRAFYSNGTYILENAAKAGPYSGYAPSNNEGPGFGEFYDDNWRPPTGHTETTVGGLAIRPGSGEIVVGSMDPHDTSIWAAGVRYLSNSNGSRTHAYAIYNNTADTGSTEVGKSTGVGDIELVCDNLSYLEIGNRVWVDADQDGIQDPGEAGVPNVTVRLFQGSTQVGTAVTNANGNYYFRSSAIADSNTNDEIGLVNGGIQTTTAYEVRVAKSQSSLNGLLMTLANADISANGDARDSDSSITASDFVIALTTGSVGQNDHTFDIGFFYNDYSLGNRVWFDLDNSGTINGADGGTPGADGVVVRLLQTNGSAALDNTGAPVANQTTANGGYYRFDHLPVGDYVVELAASNFTGLGVLNGLLLSTGAGQEANPNSDVDSNDNGLDTPVAGAIRSGTVTLGPNCSEPTNEANLGTGDPTEPACHTNLTVDFGFVVPLNLGNLVWKDFDNDGVKDVGEPGIDGVVVDLYLDRDSSGGFNNADTPAFATTTTSGGGFYNFTNLQPGNYTVNIINTNFQTGGMLNGCLSSTTTVASPETTVDSDDNGIDDASPGVNGIHSGLITLSAFGEPLTAVDTDGNNGNLTLDFGFYSTFSLGNRVWKDLDNSGTINAADGLTPGINGVVVRLRTSAGGAVTDAYGQPVNDQTTANGGYYRFVNLVPGDYLVEIVSGNFSGAGVLTGCISSRTTESDPNANADNNDNGLDTPVSGAIRSATITLGPAANAEPGNETDLGTGDPAEPNASTNMTLDFGFAPTYALGNRVWKDLDNSGTINVADGVSPGVNNVTVRLLKANGSPATDINNQTVADQITANGGYYRFDNLLAGDYLVEIVSGNFGSGGALFACESSRTTETNPNTDVDGNDNGLDARVAGAIRSGIVTLGPAPGSEPSNETDLSISDPIEPNATNNLTIDFGFVPTFALGNRVWKDLDNSGTINSADGGAPGVDGVTVRLLNAGGNQATDLNGTLVANQTTANGGYYRFDNLLAGDYFVEITAANFTGAGVLVGCVSSRPTETSPNDNADSNDNGLDAPVSGATRSGMITLGPLPNSEPTTETDRASSDPAEPNGNTNLTVDFGFIPVFTLGNRVWKDLDNSGTINAADGGSPGVNNVVVRLLNTNGSQATDINGANVVNQTTANGGYYRFSNLLAGDYLIEIAASNFTGAGSLVACVSSRTTEANPNSDVDNNDNGVDTPVSGAIRSGTITLGPAPNTEPNNETDLGTGDPTEPNAMTNLSIDFGFAPTYALGNRVWKDLDNSGTINSADGVSPGVNGVTVRLLKSNGSAATDMNNQAVADQITANGGYYRFDNLLAGDYLVEIVSGNFGSGAPLFYCESSRTTEADPNTDTDSNDNGLDTRVAGAIRSGTITLGPAPNSEPTNESDLWTTDPVEPNATTNQSIDFGFVPTYALGNRVWKDLDDSGTINGAETGIDSVVVRLLKTDGNPATDLNGTTVANQTTANGGYYRFDNLLAGDYLVEVASSNFGTSAVLFSCESSRGAQEAAPNTNGDSNDNGLDARVAGAIRSGTITLGPAPGSEPNSETDRSPSDPAEPNGNTNLTVDFGFIPVYALGNRVWKDIDNSGTINGTETGVDNVVVRLLTTAGNQATDLNGVVVADQTTANGGYYRFDNLIAGDYLVEIASSNFGNAGVLLNCESSRGTQEALPNTDVDSNDNGLDTPVSGAIRSGTVTLGPAPNSEPSTETDRSPSDPAEPNANTNLTVDFGFVPVYTLGNRVWKDLDNSGTINAADGLNPGVDGVTVRLLKTDGNAAVDLSGATVANQTTANGGYYRFTNLIPGDYLVEIASGNFGTNAALFACESSRTTETNPNGDVDLNDNGLDARVSGAIRSGTITLGPNPNSEPTSETDLWATDPTEPNGSTNQSIDFGFVPTYALGNRVWKDLDNSGTINAADGLNPGVDGVVVRLLKSDGSSVTDINGQAVANQTTANGGYYRFENLLTGDYIVEVASSNFGSGASLFYCESSRTTEANPNLDTDQNDNGLDTRVGGAIRSAAITLGPNPNSEPNNETDRAPSDPAEPNGNTNLTLDFGFVPTYALGNRVWKDLDYSGTINAADGGTPGLNGIVVRLLKTDGSSVTDVNGQTVANQTTANGGYYRFDNLLAGDYVVEVASSNFASTGVLFGCASSRGAQEASPNSNEDSNDNGLDAPVSGAIRSGTVTLGPSPNSEPTNETDRAASDPVEPNGNTNLTVDFGFISTYVLGNRVWKDADNSGTRNGSEVGVNNVVLRLVNATTNVTATDINGATVANQTTANGGYYRFENLPGGDYFVEVIASNFTTGNALFGCVTSTGAPGFVSTGTGPNEPAPDADTNATDGDDNGSLNGSVVRSLPVTLGPTGANEPANEADLGPGDTGSVPDAVSNLTVDFGFTNPMNVGNLVWKDYDNDGVRDLVNPSEPVVGNVKLVLYSDSNNNSTFELGTDTMLTMQNTANDGSYSFANLLPGNYFVVTDASNFNGSGTLVGCFSSTGNTAGNSDVDNSDHGVDNATPATLGIASSVITLVGGTEPTNDGNDANGNQTIDFGFVPNNLTIGNLIWKDLNFDGIKNGAEVGIANVKLNLYRDTNRNRVFDSASDVLVAMQTTNSSGGYLFANLIPDLYFVQVDASNFAPNGSLHGCASSNRTVDGNSDINEQDHGSTSTNPFLNPPTSSVIDLVAYNEPDGPDGDGNNGNLTIDFGFVTVAISTVNDMGMCVSPGATLTLTTNVSNPGLTTQGNNPGSEFTATFPAGIFGVPGTGTSSGGGTITVTSTGVTWDGTIPPAGTVTLSYRVQVANNAQAGTNLCVTSTVYADSDNNGTNEGSMSTQTCHVVNCPPVAPGEIPSNGSASSVLIFPLYSSSASNPADQNTRINITNYHPVKAVNLHLFYVDGASCSVADAALCLTAQQTSSFLMSDIDPGTTGYLMAVAVDSSGCPINFNYLGGDAFVKFESGHRGNLDAHGIPAIAGGTLACDANSNSTTLNFDGLNYGLLPRTVVVSNIASPEDGNSMMLFFNRIGGNYMVGADKLGSVFGLLYDDAEKSYSFSFTPNTCQFRSELSSSFPRSTPRLPGVIPAGRSGWMKLFSQGDAGIVGGTLNHNPNSATQANAYNGGRPLHIMTFSNAASVTIPVFPPHC